MPHDHDVSEVAYWRVPPKCANLSVVFVQNFTRTLWQRLRVLSSFFGRIVVAFPILGRTKVFLATGNVRHSSSSSSSSPPSFQCYQSLKSVTWWNSSQAMRPHPPPPVAAAVMTTRGRAPPPAPLLRQPTRWLLPPASRPPMVGVVQFSYLDPHGMSRAM